MQGFVPTELRWSLEDIRNVCSHVILSINQAAICFLNSLSVSVCLSVCLSLFCLFPAYQSYYWAGLLANWFRGWYSWPCARNCWFHVLRYCPGCFQRCHNHCAGGACRAAGVPARLRKQHVLRSCLLPVQICVYGKQPWSFCVVIFWCFVLPWDGWNLWKKWCWSKVLFFLRSWAMLSVCSCYFSLVSVDTYYLVPTTSIYGHDVLHDRWVLHSVTELQSGFLFYFIYRTHAISAHFEKCPLSNSALASNNLRNDSSVLNKAPVSHHN